MFGRIVCLAGFILAAIFAIYWQDMNGHRAAYPALGISLLFFLCLLIYEVQNLNVLLKNQNKKHISNNNAEAKHEKDSN